MVVTRSEDTDGHTLRPVLVDTRSEDTDGHTLRPVLVDTRSDFTDGLALWPKPCQLYGRETLRPSRKIQILEIDKLYGRFNFMAMTGMTVKTLRTVSLYGCLRPLHGHGRLRYGRFAKSIRMPELNTGDIKSQCVGGLPQARNF